MFRISPLGFRNARIDAVTEGVAAVRFIAATETEDVKRMVYDEERDEVIQAAEILRCDTSSVRFNASAVLLNHNGEKIVGPVTDLTAIDRKVSGAFEYDDTDDGQRAKRQVNSGSLRGVSAGYIVNRYQLVRDGETWEGYRGPALVATDWEIREVSLTPIPADINAGITREQLKRGVSVCIDAGTPDHQQEAENMNFRRMGLRSLLFDADNGAGGGGVPETQAAAPVASAVPETQTRAAAPANVLPVNDQRAEHILTWCEAFDCLERATTFINERSLSAEDVRLKLLAERNAKNAAESKAAIGGSHSISVGENNALAAFREAGADALMIRGGVIDHRGNSVLNIHGAKDQKPIAIHADAGKFSGLRFIDLVRQYLDLHGVRTWGKSDAATLSAFRDFGRRSGFAGTSDFSVMLENAMNKTMDLAYQLTPSTYQLWCNVIPANDLRAHGLYQKGGLGSLSKIAENGEVPTANQIDGKKESVTPETYSRIWSLTDTVIINDDLGFLTGFSADVGEAAQRTVNELVYYTLKSNPTMNETSEALFSAAHNNIVTTGAVPSVTTLDAAYAKMMLQKNRAGKIINVMPAMILAPVSLRGTVNTLLNSEFVPGGTNETRNIYFRALDAIFEPLLDTVVSIEEHGKEAATAAANVAGWYLFGTGVSRMVVAEYGGGAPIIDQARPIDILGTQYRATKRFGVAPADYRGMFYNDGVT